MFTKIKSVGFTILGAGAIAVTMFFTNPIETNAMPMDMVSKMKAQEKARAEKDVSNASIAHDNLLRAKYETHSTEPQSFVVINKRHMKNLHDDDVYILELWKLGEDENHPSKMVFVDQDMFEERAVDQIIKLYDRGGFHMLFNQDVKPVELKVLNPVQRTVMNYTTSALNMD